MRKRCLSILLVLALCLAYMPVQVFALTNYEVSTAEQLKALTLGDDDYNITLTANIDDPDYTWDLSSVTASHYVVLDLNGFSLNLNVIRATQGTLDIISSVAGSGTLTVNSLLMETRLALNDGVTVNVNDTFVYINDIGVSISNSSTLNLNGGVTIDYTSDATDAGIIFDDEVSKVVIAAVDTDLITTNLPEHASTMAAKYIVPAQISLTGNDTTGRITAERTVPTGGTETYTGPLTIKEGEYPAASATVDYTMPTYNGSSQDLVSVSAVDGGTPWYYYEGAWSTTIPTATDVGGYSSAGYVIIGDGSHVNSAETSPVTFGITTLDVTVTITGNTRNVTYDGTTQSVTGYTATADSALYDVDTDFTFTGTATASGTNAGPYYMTLTIGDFTNTDPNFNPTFAISDGSLTIEQRNVTLTSGSTSRKYDGTPLTNEEVTVTGDGWADGEGATYSGFASITDPGSTANTFTYTLNAGTTAGNYNITQTSGTLTIYDRAAFATPAGSVNPDYTGEPQNLMTAATSDQGTVVYSTDEINWSTTIPTGTDAGDYMVYAMVQGDATHSDSLSTTISSSIGRAAAIVKADDQAKKIGAADPTLTATVTGTYGTDSLVYTVARAAGEAIGTYTITPSGDATQGNYTVTYQTGTLTITDLDPAAWTQEPAIATGLTYNGEDQPLVTAGTAPAGCTAQYSLDGVTWSEELPTGNNAGEYEVYYRILGDGVNYADSAVTGPVAVTIEKATATVTVSNKTVTIGEEAPALGDTDYTITGLIGTDELAANIWAYYGTDPASPIAASDIDTSTAGTTYNIGIELDTINANYLVMTTNGTLTVQAAGGGGGGGGTETPNENSYDFTPEKSGIGSYTATEVSWSWGERAQLPKDVADFYKVLVENSVPASYAPRVEGDALLLGTVSANDPLQESLNDALPGGGSGHSISSFLASDDIWVLPAEDSYSGPVYTPEEALVCEDHEPVYLANGDGKVDAGTFGNSDFYVVGVGTGDTKIDYPNLTTGDVVSNTTFNGVFVTRLQKSNNPTFDADLSKLKSDTIASFRAFELDHPEVFWLNGSIKLRVLTVTISGVQSSYIFMTLVDDSGFTMRIAEYAASGAIETAIQQRDAAAAAIIAQIPAGATAREKIVNLNKWFTLNNEYNRSADLNSIGFTPHRSLKSLMGNEGTNGPVCDGYSRGFKMICDRIGIPVILDTGVASIGSHSELHMWMRVQVDGTWYGMDCTWDDPIVSGKNGKVSGYENEKYLLVGNDTVVDGKAFGVSHPVNATAGGTTGVLFASLIVNVDSIEGYIGMPFEDVGLGDWYYDYVKDVFGKRLMGETSEGRFSPQGTATRGQIVQILYNAAGQPAVDEVKVDGWFGKAATWAMEKGIVAGYADGSFHGDDTVTREQLATILWAYEGAPAVTGQIGFADADAISPWAQQPMLWAKLEGIIGGKPGNLADPQGTATRAEIATIFSNYMK